MSNRQNQNSTIKLENFLLELGTGFTFVARQKRISFDNKHFRIDLVFYNRILRCFVLIDLKIGELITPSETAKYLLFQSPNAQKKASPTIPHLTELHRYIYDPNHCYRQ